MTKALLAGQATSLPETQDPDTLSNQKKGKKSLLVHISRHTHDFIIASVVAG